MNTRALLTPHRIANWRVLLLAVLALWCAGMGYAAWKGRQQALAAALDTAAVQVRSLEGHFTQALQTVKLLAHGLEPRLSTPLDAPQLNGVLAEAIRTLPHLRSLSVADAQGRLLASSNPDNVGQWVPLDGLYPQAPAAVGLLRLGSATPGRDWHDRAAPANPDAALSTHFVPAAVPTEANGQLHWVVATLNPDHFIGHALGLLRPHPSHVHWVRYDGAPLWASLPDMPMDAQRLVGSTLAQRVEQRESGQFQNAGHPGFVTLAAYRASSSYPAVLSVETDRDGVLAQWREDMAMLGLGATPLLLLLLALGAWVRLSERQRLAELAQLAEDRRLAASVFDQAQEGIFITDSAGRIVDVNQAFERITGYTRAEVLGQNPRILSSGRQPPAFYEAMWATLMQTGQWTGEIWNRRKSGEVYAEMLNISVVQGSDGRVSHYVAMFSDITRVKEHEQQLERLAHFDALTGLPNRALLLDRLRQAMAQALRRSSMLAVVFLDLDGFKAINDTHGHPVGDRLLAALATRMRQALRDGDTLARLGGDEFVAVLHDLPNREASLPLLERLRLAAGQPVALEGTPVLQVSASLGLAFFPQTEALDADQLLRQADQAMYQAKVAGKNRYHVFDAAHDRSLREQHENLDAFQEALATDQLTLYYQPKVHLRTGQVIGLEALVRWNHPTRGMLGPGAFLPAIQNHPLIVELGHWVLARAARQIGAWKAQGLHLPVSVNLDAQQLQDHELVRSLQRLRQQQPHLQPGDLRLEVLETNAIGDIDQVARVMADCRGEGVDFALDDFGTGYSSLAYLRRLPVRELKIDQSFVRHMLHSPDDLSILEAVLGLARAFQREALAEGVETVEHGTMLLRLGCEHGQGYAIARPMPAEDVAAWCHRWQPPAEWRNTHRARTDDLPLLWAVAEHRAWLARLQAHAQGLPHSAPPQTDEAACGFGRWLRSLPDGHPFRRSAQWHDTEALHHEIHTLAQRWLAAQTPETPDAPPAQPTPDTTPAHPDWAAVEAHSRAMVDGMLQWVDARARQD